MRSRDDRRPGAAPLARGMLARYGALGLPLAFAALPVYVYAPRFYAELGVPLAAAGIILFAARCADALIDPWLGAWADHARDPARFIGLFLVPMGAGFLALFHPVAKVTPALWLALCLVCLTPAFSAASIAYQAWGARLGTSDQRVAVVAWREGFGLAGVVLAALLPQAFASTIEGGLPAAALAFTALLAACAAATLLPGVPRPAAERVATGAAGWRPWRSLRNVRFRALLAVFALNGIASAIPATLFLFFVADILGLESASGGLLGLYFAVAALALPLWVRLAARIGGRRAWALGMGIALAGFAWAWTLGRGDALAFAAIVVITGAALGADLALPGALLADLLERDGLFHEAGAFFGLWTFVTKFNLALAAGLTLPALEWAGYRSGGADGLGALAFAYCLLPCLLKGAALAMLLRNRP